MGFCSNFAADFERKRMTRNNNQQLKNQHYANKVFRIGSGDDMRRVNGS